MTLREKLNERVSSFFGQTCLVVMLALGAWLGARQTPRFVGEQARWVSIAGMISSGALVRPSLLLPARIAYLAAGLAWIFRLAIPWTSWVTVLAFTLVGSILAENNYYVGHEYQLVNLTLITHALWYQFYRRELRESKRFWSDKTYPQWVYFLCVYQIAIFYTWSGWWKIMHSGLSWADGVSLQIWLFLWGEPSSLWTRWLLAHRLLARIAQGTTLVLETCALFALLSRRLRFVWGVGLVAFHLVTAWAFGWTEFYANAAVLVLFFLPTFAWLKRAPKAEET